MDKIVEFGIEDDVEMSDAPVATLEADETLELDTTASEFLESLVEVPE